MYTGTILVFCSCRRICILTTSLQSHLSLIVPLGNKRIKISKCLNLGGRYLLSQACLTFMLSTCQEMTESLNDSSLGRMVLENAIHSL